MSNTNPILFESFVDLVYKLGHPPLSKRSRPDGTRVPLSPDTIFRSWVDHLVRPLPPHSGKHVFRLLFPHDGPRRRYGLRETKLAAELEVALGLSGLDRWDVVTQDQVGAGCLGSVVENAMKARLPKERRSRLTLQEVDSLLDQLATPSPFSQLSQPPTQPLSSSVIISRLFRTSGLTAYALSVLTQIILLDLRPLLCPPPRACHPTAMLRRTLAAAPRQLALHNAMWVWDPTGTMARLYRDGKGCVDWCADTAEVMARSRSTLPIAPGPIAGMNVQIPKCQKGRSITDAMSSFFKGTAPLCETVYAETKYDGYRMQIHIQRDGDKPKITIFSKSKRDSTVERGNTHAYAVSTRRGSDRSIILASLGLRVPPKLPQYGSLAQRVTAAPAPRRKIRASVILEAEVIPWNEGQRDGGRGPGIEEFWWLGAAGMTTNPFSTPRISSRHLCLAYFDVLHVDGENLLQRSYDERRKILEQVTRPIHGYCFVAERIPISLSLGRLKAEHQLRDAFQASTEARQEGLVLKADVSTYNSSKLRWVKLKKDSIPNLGDCIDLVVLGAGWDRDRARELRVNTSVYTTFYVGTMTNGDLINRCSPPHFQILFRASYGMDRAQLEIYNENIRLEKWRGKPFDKNDPWKRRLIGLSWQYTLPPGMPPPSLLFESPLCAEIMGAGFQRLRMSDLYELRWPRVLKIFEKTERPWTMALQAHDLKAAAHQSLGYSVLHPPVPQSPEDDSITAPWRSRSSATVVDIPDLSLSPRSPRKPPSPKRFTSAPEVLKTEVLKTSPRSPAITRLHVHEPPLSPLARSSETGRDLIGDRVMSPSSPSEIAKPKRMAPFTNYVPNPALVTKATLHPVMEAPTSLVKRKRASEPAMEPATEKLPSRLTSLPPLKPYPLAFSKGITPAPHHNKRRAADGRSTPACLFTSAIPLDAIVTAPAILTPAEPNSPPKLSTPAIQTAGVSAGTGVPAATPIRHSQSTPAIRTTSSALLSMPLYHKPLSLRSRIRLAKRVMSSGL